MPGAGRAAEPGRPLSPSPTREGTGGLSVGSGFGVFGYEQKARQMLPGIAFAPSFRVVFLPHGTWGPV